MNKFNESNKLEKELEDMKKSPYFKWGYSSDDKYKVGDVVRYYVMDVSTIKTELKEGKIVSKEAEHSNYDFTITDIFSGMRWGVNKEWIKEKVVTIKDESSMHPSTIASTIIKNECESVKSFLNRMYGLNTDLTFYDEFVNKEDNKMKNQKKRNRNIIKTEKYQRTIKDITFNGPAVIVKFEPTGDDLAWGRTKGDKVVVVCKDGDKYDMKTGFLLAILKEFLNNQSYGNILEKLDSFDAFDIPKVEKEKIFDELDKEANKINNAELDYEFQVGDIVRLKHGEVLFKVLKQSHWKFNERIVYRYRLMRLGKSNYTTYENENRLELVKRKGK